MIFDWCWCAGLIMASAGGQYSSDAEFHSAAKLSTSNKQKKYSQKTQKEL